MTRCPLCGCVLGVDVDAHILYQYAIGSIAHAGAARRMLGEGADRYSAIRRLEASAPFLAMDARMWGVEDAVADELRHISLAAEEARRVSRAAREAVRSSWALDDERITELAEAAEDAACALVDELEKRAVDLREYLREL